MQTPQAVYLGPEIGYATLQEPDQIVLTEVTEIYKDLVCLRDIMFEFNLLTGYSLDAKEPITGDGNRVVELKTVGEYDHKRRERLLKLLGAISGSGIGITGFLAGPIVGIGAVVLGGIAGWYGISGLRR